MPELDDPPDLAACTCSQCAAVARLFLCRVPGRLPSGIQPDRSWQPGSVARSLHEHHLPLPDASAVTPQASGMSSGVYPR
eukprot:s787_g3.t1